MHEAHIDKFKIYGPILKEEYQYKKAVVHLIRPQDFQKVLYAQGIYPNRPVNEFVCHYRTKNKDKYANVGISNQLGEQWFKQRQLYAPVLLKLGILDVYLPNLNEICNDLVIYLEQIGKKLDDHCIEINDLQSITYRLALESICMLCLDSRMDCLIDRNDKESDGSKLIQLTKNLFAAYQELYYSPPLWKLFETKAYRQYAESEDSIYQIADKYVDNALIKLRQTDESNTTNSILKTLLSLENVDERDVRTLIIDFISGGINTVSNSLSFILFHLANNINVQNKLYKEINEILDSKDQQITGQHLNKMNYLKACVKESFRINSTIPCLVRILPEEIVLNGYKIPAHVGI